MPLLNRRGFVALAAAAAAPARTLKTFGAQLYTLRNVLPKAPLDTLRALEQIGYREVEVIGSSVEQVWASLMQTKLKAVSMHLDTSLFMTATDKLPAALDDAKMRGLDYVVCPYIAPKDRGGADVIRRLAATLNKAGERSHAAGLHLCYHNHAFEFEPSGDGTLLDILMKETDPKLVSLELDIMWAQVAGVPPVSVIGKYGHRIALMHLKNIEAGVEKRYKEDIPRTAFRDVGAGVIDVPAVLKAAAKSSVKHYFVEQDQTPGDPLDALRKSYGYLSKLKY